MYVGQAVIIRGDQVPRRHSSGFDVLGMSEDPTPGDPDEIRRLADRYRQVGRQAETADRILGSGGAVEQGSGKAMDALRKQLKSLPDKLNKTAQSFSQAAGAYETYAGQLQEAQSQVDRAMDQAGPVAGTAGQSVPTLAPDATDQQRADARRQQDGIDAAQQTMSAARRLAEDARNLREQASRRAGQELDDAAAKAIPERNFFQKIADFFADFPFVKILIDILVAVVAVFFPVAGFLLGAALFAFQTAQQIVTGDFKAGDFAAGILALVPGAALFKLGGRAAGGFGKLTPALAGGASAPGGFVRVVPGSITKFAETITSSRAVAVVFESPAGKLAVGTVGEFGVRVGQEAVVKKLNDEEITAGNLLAGAAAGALVGAGIKGGRAARNGEFAGGAFTPPPASAASPAGAAGATGAAGSAGAAGAAAGGAGKVQAPEPPPILGDKATEQGLGLIQEGASSGAKVGVAVAEGQDPNAAILNEAGNFLPLAAGPVGKRAASQGIDSLIPIKGTPPPAPAAANPADVSSPPSPTGGSRPTSVDPADVSLPPSPTSPSPPPSPTGGSRPASVDPANVPLPPSPTSPSPSPTGGSRPASVDPANVPLPSSPTSPSPPPSPTNPTQSSQSSQPSQGASDST